MACGIGARVCYILPNISQYIQNPNILKPWYIQNPVDPDYREKVTNAKENNLELPFPWILQEHTNNQYSYQKPSDNNYKQ